MKAVLSTRISEKQERIVTIQIPFLPGPIQLKTFFSPSRVFRILSPRTSHMNVLTLLCPSRPVFPGSGTPNMLVYFGFE